ncbi:unnamed protein product [Cuscuta epithymum]|uniref:Uncharacterized protein n=1 Tax=Cuscuta epithymum TaxID=186058 RepID=A0AAV0CPW6_9ASTE|nr:unnamed protein product [Cuscuta epithymum]
MDWLIELMTSALLLLLKPLPLITLCVKSCGIVVLTCIELLRNAISLHLSIFWSVITLAFATFTLPMRLLNALQNEKTLEMQLQEMQIELERVDWERRRLEKQLSVAINEHKMMALMLRELEDELDQAFLKIDQLEEEHRDLKGENQQLKEIRGKGRWSQGEHFPASSSKNITYNNTNKNNNNHNNNNNNKLVKPEVGVGLDPAQAQQHQRRKAALVKSLFSAGLSVVVGTTVWTAEEPCGPLVAALFAVVAMSLSSVVGFFFAIKNNPASEAVALLCFNWFILGTLTYPALPKVALFLSPLGRKLSGVTMKFFSGSYV